MATVIGRGYGGGTTRSAADIDRKKRENAAVISDVPAPLAEGSVASSSAKSGSTKTTTYPDVPPMRNTQRESLEEWDYTPSQRVRDYQNTLSGVEANRPEAFNSRYEGQIQSILDNILNRQKFDLNTDANYQQLYDLSKQRYEANASRAMRDTMANAAGLTGGYGNTYAATVGQQAYDRAMEGLNDRNIDLMNIAYGMYRDEMADRYNQLGAVQNVDNTDYARYRDRYNDYLTDRNYYRQRLLDEYGMDYGQYGDYLNQSNAVNEFERLQNAADLAQGNWYDQFAYNAGVNSYEQNYSEYENALNRAMQFANNGLGIPQRYASMLDADTLAMLNQIAQEAIAKQNGTGGNGRGGGGSGRGPSESTGNASSQRPMWNDEYDIDSRTPEFRDAAMRFLYPNFVVNDEEEDARANWAETQDRIIAEMADQGYTALEIQKYLNSFYK